MSLSVAIRILASKEFHLRLNNYAKDLLSYFVKKFESLFGKKNISYNIHCVLHLAEDGRRLGPLDSFGAFQYESKLGSLKKLLRNSYMPLQQVINRLCEAEIAEINEEYICPEFLPMVEHTSGPLIDGTSNPQFRQLVVNGQFTLKSDSKDSYILTKDISIATVLTICYCNTCKEQVLLVKRQLNKSDFFNCPCESGKLNIYLFDYIIDSSPVEVVRFSDIYSKVQVFDTGEGLAAFPLLH